MKEKAYKDAEGRDEFSIEEAIKMAKEKNKQFSKFGIQFHLKRTTINKAKIIIEEEGRKGK